MPTKSPSVWVEASPSLPPYLPPVYDFEQGEDKEWKEKKPPSPGHMKPQKERSHKKERISLPPLCYPRTKPRQRALFGAKCSQIFLWTSEILLLGLQKFTEVKLTPEERGGYHMRT